MLDIVVGTQYGDEGKGRIVHNLALDPHYIAAARAQGGNNAGHTVVHENMTYKLNLLPTSVLTKKMGFLGRGMVLDLDVLVQEISGLKEKGIHPQLMIDTRAHVIMPWHKDLDGINEKGNRSYAAGSTGRGIGPVYGSKHERSGIRIIDFFDDIARVEALTLAYATRVAHASGQDQAFLFDRYSDTLFSLRERVGVLRDSLGDVSLEMHRRLLLGEDILGECAQAEMLDVDGAYYPRGTSSGTSAVAFWNGIGVYPKKAFAGEVIGVAKAYTTRVGSGPFVTEIGGKQSEDWCADSKHTRTYEDTFCPDVDINSSNELEKNIALRRKGGEYGTTTERPRRVGWLDIPMIRQSLISSGLDSLAITKIDILGGMDEIPVALHYGREGVPCLGYEDVKPVYRTMKAWPQFSKDEYREQLDAGIDYIPNKELRAYLQLIQDETGIPISMVTFGQDSSAFLSYR